MTTTPIPDDHPTIDHTRQADYRTQELAVAQNRADFVVDIYSLMVDGFEETWRRAPTNLHLIEAGSMLLAQKLADAIETLKAQQAVAVPEFSAFWGSLWFLICATYPRWKLNLCSDDLSRR